MTNILGFTGTRHGMTERQKIEVAKLLQDVDELHHGMCAGSDHDCHNLARAIHAKGIWIVGHPPKDKKLFVNMDVDELREPEEYLVRDENIIKEVDKLIATPHTMQEMLRSGTWATIRYAIQHDKWATIIYPNGEIEVR